MLPVWGWASKLSGQLVRIAAHYEPAANAKTESVSAENMYTALALAPYLKAHALKALAPPSRDQPAMKVLSYLIGKAQSLESEQNGSVGSVGLIPYQFTTRSLQNQFNKTSWLRAGDQPAMTLRGLLHGLARSNWVRLVVTESTENGGRPAKLWKLHPEAAEYLRQLHE
jgi:hypothetical protein